MNKVLEADVNKVLAWLIIVVVLLVVFWFAFGSRWYWEGRAKEAADRVMDACLSGTRADLTRERIEANAVFRKAGMIGHQRSQILDNQLQMLGCR